MVLAAPKPSESVPHESDELDELDEAAWRQSGREARAAYRCAQPWPHLVLTGLLSEDVVAAAEREEFPRARSLTPHLSHLGIKAESPKVAGTSAGKILDALSTPAFVGFLEELTEIGPLRPDPGHFAAGLHVSARDSFQSVHRDFFRHPVTKLWHRVDVLVYLNSQWPEAYGGDLELWPPDMRACGARIRPTAGTVVIFETNYETLHGVPNPTTCPPDRLRLSLASYYYSENRHSGRNRQPLLRSPRRPQDPWWTGIGEPAFVAFRLLRPLYRRSPARLKQGVAAMVVGRRKDPTP